MITLEQDLLTAAKSSLRAIIRAILLIQDGKVETFEERKDLMDGLAVSRDALIQVFARMNREK